MQRTILLRSLRKQKARSHRLRAFLMVVEGGGFEPPKAEPSDLQSDPFGHSGTPPQGRKAQYIVSGFSKEKSSNVLLSHGNSHTTIGANTFHC